VSSEAIACEHQRQQEGDEMAMRGDLHASTTHKSSRMLLAEPCKAGQQYQNLLLSQKSPSESPSSPAGLHINIQSSHTNQANTHRVLHRCADSELHCTVPGQGSEGSM
jgi:hypothetical protein